MLYIPEAAWRRMLAELARHEPGLERVAYLDGVRVGSVPDVEEDGLRYGQVTHAVVTTVTIPAADLHERWFKVSADAMRAAGRHLRDLRLTRLAQVHTHANDWVDHSETDDDAAYSQRVGAVSIVLPFHGARHDRLEQAGVLVRDRDRWRRLSTDQTATFISFTLELFDSREQSCLASVTDTQATPTALSNRRLKSLLDRWSSRSTRR